MKKQISTLLIALLLSANVSLAASNYNYKQNNVQPTYQSNYQPQKQTYSANSPLRGSIVTVPPGIQMPAVTTMEISSANLTIGQSIFMAIGSDFYYNNNMIAPAGSSVMGTVTQVSKAKHGSMNGKLQIRFTQITTPYGVQIPISGLIKTEDGTGTLIGGTKMDVTKAYAKDIAIGTAAGALSGLVFGAIAGGNIGKGAALGTAVGAGGGLVKSGIDKGQDVIIPVNSSVEIMLTQPITINPAAYSYDY